MKERMYTQRQNGENPSGITWRNYVPQPNQKLVNYILSSIFLNGYVDAIADASDVGKTLTEKFHAIANIKSDAIILTIHKKAENITEKIGDITLLSDELDISLFDWCNTIIQLRDKSQFELSVLRSVVAIKDNEIKKLKETLDQMIKLKGDHENELMEKFALLLNEKKIKIREQYRSLQLDSIGNSKPESRKKPVGPEQDKSNLLLSEQAFTSRRKRKVVQANSESEFESEAGSKNNLEDTTFDDFDKDSKVTSDATETETDDEEFLASVAQKNQDSGSISDMTQESSPATMTEEVILPPKRQLPFAKDTSATKSKMPKSAVDFEDVAEVDSDDEL